MTAGPLRSARTERVAVAFGPLMPYGQRTAKIGGDPPSKVLIFPTDRWLLAEGDSLVTDAESFRQVIGNFDERGILVVFDYEHMTIDEFRKPGELPIAAGFITALEVTPEGLVGSVTWTPKAAQHIAAGEYLYHSPVAIYDKTTLRVIALHSCALTNTPRTNNQKPITEQVAAKIIAACWPNDRTEGGDEMQWVDLLMQFLSGRYDSTPPQKIAMLQALIDALNAVDTAGIAAASENAISIMEHLGLVRASEVAPAATEVVAALGLEHGVPVDTIVARIAEMKTGVMPKSDHDAAIASIKDELGREQARVAELSDQLALARTGDVESLIATNLEKLSPALRQNIRTVAKADKALAVEMIANITGSRVATVTPPSPIAGIDPIGAPTATATAETASHRAWRGEVLPVSESSGSIAAAIRAIQQAAGCDYAEATRRYHKGGRHAA
jgi:hypothetical protein